MQPSKSLKVRTAVPLFAPAQVCPVPPVLGALPCTVSYFCCFCLHVAIQTECRCSSCETVTLNCAQHVFIPAVILFLNTGKSLNVAWHHWTQKSKLCCSYDLSLPENSFRIQIFIFCFKCIGLAYWTGLSH